MSLDQLATIADHSLGLVGVVVGAGLTWWIGGRQRRADAREAKKPRERTSASLSALVSGSPVLAPRPQ